ncbi:hypothetical protein PISL3812_01002 [Talaromyces islandicus]|uniref:Uncharacterized protein n=1 Tax=Talaromyces islandicus TaxID=28573 RepID=A0A0U1LKU4_TALIS|nr:hypothetical protein PISL3812_01002 [Talaromyces islandicus]
MSQPVEHPILDHIALRQEWDKQLEESLKQVKELTERALSHQNQHNHHHSNPRHTQDGQQTGESQQDADSPNSQ